LRPEPGGEGESLADNGNPGKGQAVLIACGSRGGLSLDEGPSPRCGIPLETTRRVPDPDLTVATRRGQLRPVGVPRDGVEPRGAASEHEGLFSRKRVPDAYRTVIARRSQPRTVRAPGDPFYPVVMAAHGREPPTCLGIPDNDE